MNYKLALLGKNIKHSKSPLIHKTIMTYLNVSGTYELLDFKDELNSNYLGYNVTSPYKVKAIKYLTGLSDIAKEIGAVNTIYKRNNDWLGTNTDYDGFIFLLQNNNINVKNKRVYILGSGGAALAVYKAVIDLQGRPTIVTRNNHDYLANKNYIFYKDLNKDDVDLYVHATSIDPKNTVINQSMVENHLVIELQVHNTKTKIETLAKKSINGLDMLIYQALKSAEIWFERDIINNDIIKLLKEVVQR